MLHLLETGMGSKSLKKNAFLNFVKQLLKIAFPLITFPYVSRILQEENFGKYNFSLSVSHYFLLFASLGIATYAVREGARLRNDKEKLNRFANEVFSINVFSSLVSYGLLFLSLLFVDKFHSYRLLILIQSANILFNTLGTDWVNTIYEDYEYMTKRYIFVKLISLFLIFAFVREKEDYYLYTLIVVFSEVLANIANIIYVRRYVHLKLVIPSNLMVHLIPLCLLFVNELAVTVYSNADILMIGFQLGDEYVGVYSVSSKIYQIAKGLINSVLIVMIPRLSFYLGPHGSERQYNRLLVKVLKCTLMITLPMAIGMVFLRKEAILLLGGKNYLIGASALGILSLSLIPVCIGSVLFNGVLIPKRGEKYCLLSTFLCACVNVLLNYFLIRGIGLIGAAIATLAAEMLSAALAIYFSCKTFSVKFSLDKDFLSIIVSSAMLMIVCWLVGIKFSGIVRICASVFAGAAVYFLVLLAFHNSVVYGLLEAVKMKWKGRK